MLKKLILFLPFGIIVLFLLLKFSYFPYRFSDTPGYFVLGEYLLQGKLLYKDIFFTNLPMFGYISAFYVLITNHNLLWFAKISCIELAFCAIMIILILRHEKVALFEQCLVVTLFLFSFLVLMSSEFNTGTFTSTLFLLTGYLLYKKEQFVWSAVLFAIAFTTKGYTLPIIFSMVAYDMYVRRFKSWNFIVPLGLAVCTIMLPTLLTAPIEFIRNVFGYSVTRPANNEKWSYFGMMVTIDWLYILFTIAAFIHARKNVLLALIIFSTFFFLLAYQDSYYFYFNIVLPFIVLSIPETIKQLKRVIPSELLNVAFVAVCGVSLALHFQSFITSLNTSQLQNPEKLIEVIKKADPDYIYGMFDVAPLISHLTGKPLLNGLIDTNEKLFYREIYDSKQVTKDAIQKKTIMVFYGQTTVESRKVVKNDIADFDTVTEKCQLYYEHPIIAANNINRIYLMKCY